MYYIYVLVFTRCPCPNYLQQLRCMGKVLSQNVSSLLNLFRCLSFLSCHLLFSGELFNVTISDTVLLLILSLYIVCFALTYEHWVKN